MPVSKRRVPLKPGSVIILINGVTSAYVFDDAGRLSDLVHRREGSDLASYHYEYDPLGNRTRAVEGGSAHGQPPETPPSQFMAEQQGYMAIGLGWPDSAVNEVSYTLERSTDGQNWQVVSTLTANTLRFVDEGLTRHTDYWYRLTASNGQGGSEVHTLRTRTAFDPVIYPASGPTEDLVIDYGYDPLDRLTTADDNDERYYHYSYDAVGNRLSETTPAGTTSYVYDDANRLTSVGGVSYAWDDNGNLTGDGANTYSYDAANRLVGIVGSSLSASYTYNGLGDRVSQVENGVATSFVLDLAGGLTQVLVDGTNTYLYGNERIGQFTAGTAEYFLGDALGSVRQLIDGDGIVGVVKRYEPYGELVSSVGESSSAFGFTGEWTSSTNLVYLRARYYSSSTGRFLTRDSWPGDYYTPISHNTWLYGFANPIKFTDPTGHNPNCKRSSGVCAKERLQEIINGARNNGAEALFRTFEDWELEGLWSDAAGRNSRDRLEWLLGVTAGSLKSGAENMAAPLFHVQMKYHFGDDCGFAEEFRDNQFHKPEIWNLKEQSNLAGHFLTAVGITYWWVIAGNIGSDPNYSHIWPMMGLAAIIGHEMESDSERGFVFRQVWRGLMKGSEVLDLWDHAVQYDSQGLYYDRDQELWKILNFKAGTKFGEVDRVRVGNSLQDLRLSLKGYRFAYWVHENASTPPQEAGMWLRVNLSNTLKSQGPSVR